MSVLKLLKLNSFSFWGLYSSKPIVRNQIIIGRSESVWIKWNWAEFDPQTETNHSYFGILIFFCFFLSFVCFLFINYYHTPLHRLAFPRSGDRHQHTATDLFLWCVWQNCHLKTGILTRRVAFKHFRDHFSHQRVLGGEQSEEKSLCLWLHLVFTNH